MNNQGKHFPEIQVMIDEQTIRAKITELAARIEADYPDELPILMCPLKGAVVFYVDLVREFTQSVDTHFIRASSYGGGMKSSGKVDIRFHSSDVAGKSVILVEDIMDSGHTATRLTEFFMENGATDVQVCVLLDKPSRREVDITAKYVGFEIEDVFVVGYGMDADGKYRNLKYVGMMEE